MGRWTQYGTANTACTDAWLQALIKVWRGRHLQLSQERILQFLLCNIAIVKQALSFLQHINDLLVLGPRLKSITGTIGE